MSSGAWNSSGRRTVTFSTSSSRPAAQKPTTGEISSAMNTSLALPQLTPSPKAAPLAISELTMPTPMIEPIRVCELEAGRPSHHVPRFHMIADSSSAKTMVKPADEPELITSSTGSSARMPNATAPVDTSTPTRFHRPDHTTAVHGLRVLV